MKPSKRLRLFRWRKPEFEKRPNWWAHMRAQYGYYEDCYEHRQWTLWAFIQADLAADPAMCRPARLGTITARLRAHKTQPLPTPENDAPTIAELQPRYWWWNDETAREDVAKLATVPVSAR